MLDILQILRDNWLLLLVGQYPSGPLGYWPTSSSNQLSRRIS